ncbi:MAG: beta-galactosidase, partial [Planctomycetota bacterium]
MRCMPLGVLAAMLFFVVGSLRSADDTTLNVKSGELTVDPAKATVIWTGARKPTVLGKLAFSATSQGDGEPIRQGEMIELEQKNGSVVALYEGSKNHKLKVTYTPQEEGIRVQYKIVGPEIDGYKRGRGTRFRFIYSGEKPFEYPRSRDVEDQGRTGTLCFGPVDLSVRFARGLGWHSKGKEWAESPNKGPGYMRARGENFHEYLAENNFEFTLSVKSGYRVFFREMIGPMKEDERNLEAYLEAIEIWDLGDEAQPDLDKVRETLDAFPDVVGSAMVSIKNDDPPKPIENFQKLEGAERSIEEAYTQIHNFLDEHRDELYRKVGELNEKMSFRVGLGYDNNPRKRFLKWALFNMAFFRFAPGRLNMEDPEKRFARVEDIMSEADRYGAEAILLVGGGDPMTTPEDVTYNQDYLPINRPSFCSWNFNSTRFRDSGYDALKKAGQLTRDIENIAVYQIGNEPFWSTKADIICGYNPGEIGCSNETWRQHIGQKYGSLADWMDEIRTGDYQQKWSTEKIDRLFEGENGDNVGFDAEATAGLTFVDFLRDRYGSLNKLNEAWYGDANDRYLDSWEELFPPLPIREGAETETDRALADIPEQWVPDTAKAPRPRTEDVAAWVDWAEFWSHCVNDAQLALREGLKDGGARAPVSTNAVTGHFINGFIHSSADTATNPWLAMEGLDAQGIDFYSTGYLQTYMAALRCAGESRPVYLHETEGPKQGYVAMYSFAYGASGVSIWRRDHRIQPKSALSLLKVTRAMADPELQFESAPLTDGVAVMYSLDSMYLSDAMTGSGNYYLDSLQGGTLLLNKLHVLYDLYSDRRLMKGIPE